MNPANPTKQKSWRSSLQGCCKSLQIKQNQKGDECDLLYTSTCETDIRFLRTTVKWCEIAAWEFICQISTAEGWDPEKAPQFFNVSLLLHRITVVLAGHGIYRCPKNKVVAPATTSSTRFNGFNGSLHLPALVIFPRASADCGDGAVWRRAIWFIKGRFGIQAGHPTCRISAGEIASARSLDRTW